MGFKQYNKRRESVGFMEGDAMERTNRFIALISIAFVGLLVLNVLLVFALTFIR